ncbi:MAG TPA: GNAT family N-acetyltransferase [Candidatus Desulfobacillus denitrificans]|mgnify:CR=1 FL=1|nr:GNAT family N-acetyltransferase [Rhodocyclaceae bacterium]MCC7269729.1 GNAT family N-acetyltransferase [Rhodocyclaceae bacterium]HNQ57353.1 GNAT family N-acetyltransferase [Candidatus Desulfobacillus denitrificans]HNT62945.1 GNAT family N-acetyltransferase [Candidatus Desulfobacillus denitrificans]
MSGIQIMPAHGAEAIPVARELFVEYAEQLGVDLCFQNFAEELATLPGAYAPPRGGVWLARVDGHDAGCVALRPLDAQAAELKRMYVRRAWRGRGLGRRLGETAIGFARAAGYRAVCLDTLAGMTEALALYRSSGFRPTRAYCHNPLPDTVWMELELDRQDKRA